MSFLFILVLMLALMWIFFVRPQRRRQLQQSSMLSNLEAGDEIVTAGGLYGRIQAVEEDEVSLEIAPGTNVRLAKRAIAAVLPPDEEEEEEEAIEAAPDEESITNPR